MLACPFSGPVLSRFLTQSLNIPGPSLISLVLGEDRCQALVAPEYMREDFEIAFRWCHLTEAGERVLFHGIRRNRGTTSLHGCRFNTRPLAEALRGNTRIKRFLISRSDDSITSEDVLFLLRALSENLGIEKLDLSRFSISDESWDVMCQSLANHPAIDYLHLHDTASHDAECRPASPGSTSMLMSEARKTHRPQSLVEMLKVNTAVKQISKGHNEFDAFEENLWRNEIEPRLEINKFRPSIVAVEEAQGVLLRAPLFGRALHTINDNNNFLFMTVKGNVDLLAEVFPWAHQELGNILDMASEDGAIL